MNPALVCPFCGAPVDDSTRHCSYCSAPVRTVRCARCFHMNTPRALHCEGCGFELGLEPISDGARLSCPGCTIALDAYAGTSGLLYDCNRCGGQFVESALLRDLLERSAVRGAAVPRRPAKHPGESQSVHYVPCPACAVLMGRKNFGGTSGVIVDVCRTHGVWFDSGELPRVLEFVETGGLAEERRRELAEISRRRSELRKTRVEFAADPDRDHSGESLLSSRTDPSLYHSAPTPFSAELLLEDARGVVATLLERIGEALEKRKR